MLTTKEILTREEIMEILKIGRSTFYKLLQTGELKGFKEGNRYKVPVESVEQYIEMKMRTWKNGMSFLWAYRIFYDWWYLKAIIFSTISAISTDSSSERHCIAVWILWKASILVGFTSMETSRSSWSGIFRPLEIL